MDQVARFLNAMVDAGVVSAYAVFGAVAQMRYTEAVATFDVDVLVSLPSSTGLDVLGPIYAGFGVGYGGNTTLYVFLGRPY